jgi:di/tricarboxylate transporter
MVGRSPASMRLRTLHGVNLLGIARHGQKTQARLRDVRIQHGDVLLLQGAKTRLDKALSDLDCLPLVERNVGLGKPRRLFVTVAIFTAAVGLTVADVWPLHLSFLAAAVVLIVLDVVRLDEAYDSVDWPVIVLLGAMIPVGAAVESTGGATLVADAIARVSAGLAPAIVVTVVLVGTMMLSDVINNNATAVLMAPIALQLSERLRVQPDALLMAVAIGASCAFLTPIGHQSNTLVLGPGGYRFSDYWRMGLPLEIVITAIAVPLLLVVWPL